MFNNSALKHENGVFCNVRGKVCDSLEVFRNPQYIDATADDGWVFRHEGDELPQNLVAQVIDDAVAAADLHGKLRVFVDERVKYIGKHAPHKLVHARYVDKGLDRRHDGCKCSGPKKNSKKV